jgi:hypothetical protein
MAFFSHDPRLRGAISESCFTGKPEDPNVFWADYDASNPVESSGIVGKNFLFDLRIEAH